MSEQKIQVVIVDDEPLARQMIRRLLRDFPETEIVGEASNGVEAVEMIEKCKPDLVFLDIQMPEKDGFAVLESLDTEILPVIIFVTAFNQFALQAFDAHAIDYLLKPFDDLRFAVAIERAKVQIKGKKDGNQGDTTKQILALVNNLNSRANYLERFVVKNAGRTIFIKVEEVNWIEAQDNYVSLHTEKSAYLIRETMQNLEEKLDPRRFVRIHRSTIVNLETIKELHADFNGDQCVILKDGTPLILSRRYRRKISEALGTNI